MRASLLACFAAASVAACAGGGGGGGGGSPPPISPPTAPPPPPPAPPVAPPASFETSEYLGTQFGSGNRTGLAQIGASTAYSRGATGAGITVAVIDSGVDTSISELAGRIAGTFDVITGRAAGDIDTDGHGTMVTSIIVANRNSIGIHGVAYGAQVLGIRADTGGSCAVTGTDGGCKFNSLNVAAAINYAVAHGARVINMSLGGDGSTPTSVRNAMIAAVNAGVLFTISAGNEGAAPSGGNAATGTSPSEPANIASDPAMLGRVVAVGSVGPNGLMPTYSNRASTIASFYLLAPGGAGSNGQNILTAGVDDNIRIPGGTSNDADTDGNYWSGSGTSFAAPHVAGALALLLQSFPNISATTAMQILFDTATDYVNPNLDAVLGIAAGAGIDQVGGRGLINLAAAFTAQGTVSVDFGQVETLTLGAVLGPARGALGDWVEHSGAFDGLMYQDKYNRGFILDSAQLGAARAPFNDFTMRADYARGHGHAASIGNATLSWFNAPQPAYDPRTPWAEAPEATFSLHYAFSDNGQIAIGRGEGGPERMTPAMALVNDPSGPAALGSGQEWTSMQQTFGPVTMDLRSSSGDGRNGSSFGIGHYETTKSGEAWGVRLGLATMEDANTALGGSLQSRFGGDDETKMSAMSLEAARSLGDWRFSGTVEAAQAEIGRLNVSGLWTSAWSASAETPFAGGALRFTAAQPRRAEGGELAFSAPVGLTKRSRVIYEDRVANLTPSGRELDLETAWSTRLGEMTTFETAIALSTQPNHIESAKPEAAMWLSLRHQWK